MDFQGLLPANTNIYNTSAMMPPAGVTPNLTDPPIPLQPAFVAVTAICLATTSIFVVSRVFTKLWIQREFLVEDYSLVLGWIGFIFYFCLNFATSANGKHMWDVSISDAMSYSQLINIVLIIFSPISFFAKLAIFQQLKRLFNKKRNVLWWLCEISIWTNALAYLALMFIGIFLCTPRAKIGNPFIEGTCLPWGVLVVPTTVVTLVSDVWAMFMPILIIVKLQIALQRKFALAAGFGLGVLSVAAAAMELYYAVVLANSDDVTFWCYYAAMWGGIQLAALYIAASLPSLPVLFLTLKGVDMVEHEPSELGRITRAQSVPFLEKGMRMGTTTSTQHSQQFSEPRSSFDRWVDERSATPPPEIQATTTVRITSMHMDATGLH